MKKKVVRTMTREQWEQKIAGADERFCPGTDERLTEMIVAAIQRKIRVRYLWANPATLVPHVPEALEKAKVCLIEEPSTRENMLREILGDSPGAILVYRNEDGDLVSFDDYLALAVAQVAKIQKVRVVVFREGDEWYKQEDSPIHLSK